MAKIVQRTKLRHLECIYHGLILMSDSFYQTLANINKKSKLGQIFVYFYSPYKYLMSLELSRLKAVLVS